MPVFYCPVCPLIFEHRTEVEWHLRNEHRSRDSEEAELRAELTDASAELDRARLRALQSSSDHPSVSLLMATTPAETMTGVDVARLRQLANRARRRLQAEPVATPTATVEHRLSRAVSSAEGCATHRGLAILVSSHHLAIFRLPFEPRDRVVVDPTFATRDLEELLAQHPLYRVLVLGREPRILEGRGANLTAIPLPAPPTGPAVIPRPPERNTRRRERWTTRRARVEAGCRQADELLDRRVQLVGGRPLVVLGDNRWLAGFADQSRYWPSVVGQVTGCRPRASTAEIAELAQPALAAWRAGQQTAALDQLQQASGHGRVAWGLSAAWGAVRTGQAERLWIERSVTTPGRLTSDGAHFELGSDAARPGVIDDLEDDLIEGAAARGVPVAILDDGGLGRSERVAVSLRRPWNQPGVDAAVVVSR